MLVKKLRLINQYAKSKIPINALLISRFPLIKSEILFCDDDIFSSDEWA